MVTAGTLLAACSGGSAQQKSEPAPLESRLAAAFVNSVGVNIHLGYGDTSYRDLDGVLNRLSELGVKHVRDALPLKPGPRLVSGLAALAEKDLTVDLIVAQTPRRVRDLPDPQETLDSLTSTGEQVRRVVDAVEAPNEWDLQGGGDWVSDIVGFTRTFGSLLREDPVWRNVTYVGPSTGRVERVSLLPDLGSGDGHIDIANLHSYPAGGPPEKANKYLADARKVAPGKPLWVTELGYHTAVNQGGRQPAVTESQQGSYLTRQLLENFGSGVERSYVYELAEQKPDPGLTDQEEHFGLLTSELAPKPAFTQLKTLIAGVRDPRPTGNAEAVAGSDLSVTVETPGDPVGSLLLRRTDGSYRLVLWARGTLELDGRSSARDARVNITLKGEARQVSIHRTTKGTVAGAATGDAARITGRLGGDPVIVDIGAAQVTTKASAAVVEFDTSGLTPGADTSPKGDVGQKPDRVKTVLTVVFGFVIAAAAVTIGLWVNRKRRQDRSQA